MQYTLFVISGWDLSSLLLLRVLMDSSDGFNE